MMQEVFKLLNKTALPYFRQGSLADKEYPPSFFTFWNVDTPELSFYDNEGRRYNQITQICFYTNDANLIYSKMDEFVKLAKAAGFTCSRPKDAPSDKANYSGRLVMLQKNTNVRS